MNSTLTREVVARAYDEGIIKLIPLDVACGDEKPTEYEPVVKIGDMWFFAFGQEAESMTVAEYVNNVPKDDIITEIYTAIRSFSSSDQTEYDYYLSYISEHLSELNRKKNNLYRKEKCTMPNTYNPGNNASMFRFTVAITHDSMDDTSAVDLLSSLKTRKDTIEALKWAVRAYLQPCPEKWDEYDNEITWDAVLEFLDEISDDVLEAYGLAKDNTNGFRIQTVDLYDPCVDMNKADANENVCGDAGTAKPATRFTIVMLSDDDEEDPPTLDLLSVHKTEDESMAALKRAVRDYLNANPEALAELIDDDDDDGKLIFWDDVLWDDVLAFFHKIPNDFLAAYGLATEDAAGFPVWHVDGDDVFIERKYYAVTVVQTGVVYVAASSMGEAMELANHHKPVTSDNDWKSTDAVEEDYNPNIPYIED